MYEAMMHSLRTFVGAGPLRIALMIALPLIAVGIMVAVSPSIRNWCATRRERREWFAGLCDVAVGVFKLLVVFAVVRLLMVVMVLQSDVFAHRHGEVTETNRSAVHMKWGLPHEQREMSVRQTFKRVWVTRQLKLPGEKGEVKEESYWADQEKPVAAVGGQLPQVISVSSEEKDCPVEGKAIVSADVNVTIKNNPRTLGNANYAGYEDLWRLKYVVTNRSEKETTARFTFSMPAERGVFNNLKLSVDGEDVLAKAGTGETGQAGEGPNVLSWSLTMEPGKQRTVEIGYQSRGLEHLRYIPRRMSQTGHYRVALEIVGISPAELDFPIGSMPPEEKLGQLGTSPFTLHWNLDNALTSYDIGIKLPQPAQPAYYFATLLSEAPLGLVLLLLLVVIPRIVTGEAVSLAVVLLLFGAYCLFFTFMGTLADLASGFRVPFIFSAVLFVGAIAAFRLRARGSRFLRLQDTVCFATLTVLYPLAVTDAERTGFWMQVFYYAILAYMLILVLRRLNLMPGKNRETAAGAQG